MNNETLNQVFSSTANSIRTKTGTSASIAPINFANSILNIPGATPQDIYKVASIQERDNINAKEGDIALVYDKSDRIINKNDTELTTITFPETVVLESQISGNANLRLRPSEEYEPEVQLFGGDNEVYVSIMGGSEYYDFTYTSQDGLNFTISGTYPEDRTFTTEVPIGTEPDTWEQYNSEPLTPFIHVIGIDFSGLFIYKESNWEYLNIDANVKSFNIFTENKGYSSKGMIEGTYFGVGNEGATLIDLERRIANIQSYIVNLTNAAYLCDNLYNIQNINQTNIIKYVDLVNIKPIDMTYMFNNCRNITNIPNFDTSNCTNMSFSFNSCANLTSIPNFDTSNVVNMSYAFSGCTNLTNLPNFNIINCTDMSYTFRYFSNKTAIPNFDTSNVVNMGGMFSNSHITSVPNFNMSNVKDTQYMFSYATNITNFPNFDLSNVVNMYGMFDFCLNCTSFPNFNMAKARSLDRAFSSTHVTSFPNFSFPSAESLKGTFYQTKIVNTPNINIGQCNNISQIFSSCYNLKNAKAFNTSLVKDFSRMFDSCYNLTNLEYFDTSNAVSLNWFIYKCNNLTNASLSNVLNMCINAINCEDKTICNLGLTNNSIINTIQSLPEYQDCLNAGWVLGNRNW